jgi:predicted enzyme related to lactoylglutathione lyase
MTMTRPAHFEILAGDPKKVAGFYRELFGVLQPETP